MDGLNISLAAPDLIYTQDRSRGRVGEISLLQTQYVHRTGHVYGLDRSLCSRLNIYKEQDTWTGWIDLSAPDFIYTQDRTRERVG